MYLNNATVRWMRDDEVSNCTQCNDTFTILKRKHHCRVCGKIFCAECSSFQLLIPGNKLILTPSKRVNSDEPQRSCSHCARYNFNKKSHIIFDTN